MISLEVLVWDVICQRQMKVMATIPLQRQMQELQVRIQSRRQKDRGTFAQLTVKDFMKPMKVFYIKCVIYAIQFQSGLRTNTEYISLRTFSSPKASLLVYIFWYCGQVFSMNRLRMKQHWDQLLKQRRKRTTWTNSGVQGRQGRWEYMATITQDMLAVTIQGRTYSTIRPINCFWEKFRFLNRRSKSWILYDLNRIMFQLVLFVPIFFYQYSFIIFQKDRRPEFCFFTHYYDNLELDLKTRPFQAMRAKMSSYYFLQMMHILWGAGGWPSKVKVLDLPPMHFQQIFLRHILQMCSWLSRSWNLASQISHQFLFQIGVVGII